MPVVRLGLRKTALLVVDIQEKLLPQIHNADQVIGQAGRLIEAARCLELPVLVTEQHPKGLGPTVPPLLSRLEGAHRFEKVEFSAMIRTVHTLLQELQMHAVIVCGIEAHVCVLQTCLDLLDSGFVAALAVDAIGSRRPHDQEAAQQRMIQSGVIPTTAESAIFDLVREAGTPRFKSILPIVR